MTKKERARLITERLNEVYGLDLECYLQYDREKPWQLLFATMLSAQCTDARVNMVTPALFEAYPTLEDMAAADVSEVEKYIFSTGFYHNKAKNMVAAAGVLLSDFDGKLPDTIEELTSLPGVGRKTANVILGNIFHKKSIVVDTHVKRISRLLGLTEEKDPEKVEYDLMKLLPESQWILYNHQVIMHGRKVCISGRPRCMECPLSDLCKGRKK